MFEINDYEVTVLNAIFAYHDTIMQRIQDQLYENPMKIFIYDCYVYTVQLLTDYGWTDEMVGNRIDSVIRCIFLGCQADMNIHKTLTLSEDRHFVYLS